MNAEVFARHYDSPTVGKLELCVSHRGVRSISFESDSVESVVRASTAPHPIMDRLVHELDQYFRGETTCFSVPLDLNIGTAFQRKVWDQLIRIPYCVTRSYGDIARAVGDPRAARAVGSAVGKNPVPILIPCHRVIKSDGGIGGFSSGVEIKRILLEGEGVRIE